MADDIETIRRQCDSLERWLTHRERGEFMDQFRAKAYAATSIGEALSAAGSGDLDKNLATLSTSELDEIRSALSDWSVRGYDKLEREIWDTWLALDKKHQEDLEELYQRAEQLAADIPRGMSNESEERTSIFRLQHDADDLAHKQHGDQFDTISMPSRIEVLTTLVSELEERAKQG